MRVETNRIVPITKLQKELTQTVRELSESGEIVYIMKNNTMEAVMMPFAEYEYLSSLEEMFDYFEIHSMIEKRMEKYDHSRSVEWEEVKE